MKTKLFAIFLSLLLANTIWALDNPSAGLAFLKINPDSRLTALGNAGVASNSTTSPASFLLNPALATEMEATVAQLGHSFWYANSSVEFLGVGFPLAGWHWGVLLTSANISGFEYRDNRATDEPIDTFGAHYLNAGINAAKKISSKMRVGIQANFLYEKIFYDMANGFSLSAGLNYKLNSHLSFGAALNNFGAMSKLRNESTPLPTVFRAGTAYSNQIGEGTLSYQVLLDAGYYINDYGFVAGGAEISYQHLLFFRAGVQANADQTQPALGFGIQWQKFRVNYSVIFPGNSLDIPQQLNFSIQL